MYDHKSVEWEMREAWKREKLHIVEETDILKDGARVYILVELPYPSGALHCGHWYAFTMPDMYARYRRMCGDQVLFPLGFDSFGLPAENAAIKRGKDPAAWTEENIREMKTDIPSMGLSVDPTRMIETSDPSFYKWTQWIFIRMFEKGLAYRAAALTNWCDSCRTVLANEQVVPGSDGVSVCERCKQPIKEKNIPQWFLRITDFADRLIDGLNTVDWPDQIKRQQVSWIGRTVGAKIPFLCGKHTLEVFTTRPDTLYGTSFLTVAPEHPLVPSLLKQASNGEDIRRYIESAKQKTTYTRSDRNREKTGVRVEGVTCTNPATEKEIPLYIADYVLVGHGTGAVMGVPAHDERDFMFAKTHSLNVLRVVDSDDDMPYTGDGTLINSGAFNGLKNNEGGEKITAAFGTDAVAYKLRDWTVSRQRYWGCPIPIVYDPDGVPHPVPEKHLPWLLPTDVDHTPTGDPPLSRSKEFYRRTETLFGKGWTPEVDTFDTFVDSSWYYIRYLDPKNEKEYVSDVAKNQWLPVDRYYGGAEHTTVHLLYARFFYKVLFDLGLVNEEEPFTWRLNRGLVLAPDGKKMSKSADNTVNPRVLCERYGADVVRAYLAFLGPFDGPYNYPYSERGIVGIRRFLERVYTLKEKVSDVSGQSDPSSVSLRCTARTVQRVTESIERHKFNTAVSALMECVNEYMKQKTLPREQYGVFLRLLSPIAPFISDFLWRSLEYPGSVHRESWPICEEGVGDPQEVSVVVQVNGKKRGVVSVLRGSAEEWVSACAAREIPSLQNILPKKVVFVENRVINFVQ